MVIVFFIFLGLAALPGLAVWSVESIPIKLRAVLVTALVFLSCLGVIVTFIKKLGLSYGEIGVKMPVRADLKKNILLFLSGTLACLAWFRLYLGAFKLLLPAEYARIDALNPTGYVQFLSAWGRAGGILGTAALWGGMLLLVITEELAFRGLIFTYLKRENSFKEALVWSSILFTFAHLNPYNFPVSFVAGLIFTLLYVKSGGLAVPVSAHLAYNLSLIYLGKYIH